MRQAVLRVVCAQVKISDSEIALVEVDVVNALMIGQRASKMFGHDGAMLGEAPARSCHNPANGGSGGGVRVSAMSAPPLIEPEAPSPHADDGRIAAKLSRHVAR